MVVSVFTHRPVTIVIYHYHRHAADWSSLERSRFHELLPSSLILRESPR